MATRRSRTPSTQKPSQNEHVPEMSPPAGKGRLSHSLTTALLYAVSALAFSLAFPGFHDVWGIPVFAFVALAPAVLAIHRSNWFEAFGYGALYGFVTYALHNYWLALFHPLTIFVVPGIYGAYFLVLIPVLKLAGHLMPRHGYLLQTLIWIAYEYLRTLGFLGYSYGVLGYSLYSYPLFIQISSLVGVWGVTAIAAFPSFYLGWAIREGFPWIRRHVTAGVAWAGILLLSLTGGLFLQVDYSDSPTKRLALIQQNSDPWKGAELAYERALEILIDQSTQALEQEPDMVVWSETAFVPSINYHQRYRTNPAMYDLVRELTEYLDTQTVPYVLGNAHAERRVDSDGDFFRVNYNAALLWNHGAVEETYRKVHLVPFTEHFPFERQLPWMYQLLLDFDTHFWEKGDEYTVFEVDGMRFSTPICFEDTFGYLTRRFANDGAEFFINVTNDAWSHSVPAAMQHLAMAVFRSVETRRSMARSTNAGMTALIDPNGRILELARPFEANHTVVDLPLYPARDTGYMAVGDIMGQIALVSAGAWLLILVALRVVRRFRDSADRSDR